MSEYRKRSALKSIIWRITGIIILAFITFIYTRSWIQTGLVTVIHHGVFLVVYYYHERFWLWLTSDYNENVPMLRKSIFKMITYETICGNLILGTITYLVTGSWKSMTLITITYIGIKHFVYIQNEFVWKEIKWGKT